MSEKSIWKTRHSLLDRISDIDDKQSWNEFIDQYQQFIFNVLISTGLNVSEADDLRQNIFIKLWKIMPGNPYEKQKGKFRSWLTKVIKNEVVEFFRLNNRRSRILESKQNDVKDQLFDEDRENELDAIIQNEWETQLMYNAWTKISPKLKEPAKTVFQLALDGKSHKEIAEICGINEGMVRVNKQRVKDLIKNAVDKERDI